MKPDDSPEEETLECQLARNGIVVLRLPAGPSAVVCVGNHEAREDEKEVHGEISVIDSLYYRLAAGKGKSFEYVIPYYREGCDTPEPVENLVMGPGVGKRCVLSNCSHSLPSLKISAGKDTKFICRNRGEILTLQTVKLKNDETGL